MKAYIKPQDVKPSLAKTILTFLNTAKTTEDIAGIVELPGERDERIMIARNLLARRDELGGFKSLKDIAAVPHIGPKRFTEIIMAFRNKATSTLYAGDAGPIVDIRRSRSGGSMEIQRENRIDFLCGFPVMSEHLIDEGALDLHSQDQAAFDTLLNETTLSVPGTVRPFIPFPVSWNVSGPGWARNRVLNYRLSMTGANPVFDIPTSGTETFTGWKDGHVSLLAEFNSGTRILASSEFSVNLSGGINVWLDLNAVIFDLQAGGATLFLDGVKEKAGEDVTVNVINAALAAVKGSGFIFSMGLELVKDHGTANVNLQMEFTVDAGFTTINPEYTDLVACFYYPHGDISVGVIANPKGVIGNIGAWLGYGKSEATIQNEFATGLREFANKFAANIGEKAASSDELKNFHNPRPVRAAIDMANQQFVITFFEQGMLTRINGYFPSHLLTEVK